METIACPSCDLLQVVPTLSPGARARCPRCRRLVAWRSTSPLDHSLAVALAAAAIFAIACTTSMMSIPGREGATLVRTAQAIWSERQPVTSLALAMFLVVAPAGCISSLVILLVEARHAPAPRWVGALMRATRFFRSWSMLDVAMLAMVVALTKLMEMTTVLGGLGIYAVGTFVGLLAITGAMFDRHEAWRRIEWVSGGEPPVVPNGSPPSSATRIVAGNAARSGLVSCAACHLLSRAATMVDPGHCPRCGATLHVRRRHSVQRTWAFIVAAAVCYIPANALPMLTSHALGSSDSVTVMGGILYLYHSGSWLLALVVLVASIMIPVGKLLALAYLLITVQTRSVKSRRQRTRLYRLIEVIGRWSMLDVFVDALMATVAHVPPFLWINLEPGLPFFMAVVVLTMLAARSFDTRLIWDAGLAHG